MRVVVREPKCSHFDSHFDLLRFIVMRELVHGKDGGHSAQPVSVDRLIMASEVPAQSARSQLDRPASACMLIAVWRSSYGVTAGSISAWRQRSRIDRARLCRSTGEPCEVEATMSRSCHAAPALALNSA